MASTNALPNGSAPGMKLENPLVRTTPRPGRATTRPERATNASSSSASSSSGGRTSGSKSHRQHLAQLEAHRRRAKKKASRRRQERDARRAGRKKKKKARLDARALIQDVLATRSAGLRKLYAEGRGDEAGQHNVMTVAFAAVLAVVKA